MASESSGEPYAQNQPWRVHSLRYHIWIDKDACAHSAAHDKHGGVKETQSASKRLGSFAGLRSG